VTVPDVVHVLAELQGGARAIYHMSGTALFGPGMQIHLYGSRGTIKIEFNQGQEKVWCGRAGDPALQEVEIRAEDQGRWQVEEDFIAAIRKERKVTLVDFETALEYMEFTEAVALSLGRDAPVYLPLED
jgi:predicted dehydrogenase